MKFYTVNDGEVNKGREVKRLIIHPFTSLPVYLFDSLFTLTVINLTLIAELH